MNRSYSVVSRLNLCGNVSVAEFSATLCVKYMLDEIEMGEGPWTSKDTLLATDSAGLRVRESNRVTL